MIKSHYTSLTLLSAVYHPRDDLLARVVVEHLKLTVELL